MDTVTEREFITVYFDEKTRRGYIAYHDDKGNVLRVAQMHAYRIGKISKGYKLEDYVGNAEKIADGSIVVKYKVKTTKTRV